MISQPDYIKEEFLRKDIDFIRETVLNFDSEEKRLYRHVTKELGPLPYWRPVSKFDNEGTVICPGIARMFLSTTPLSSFEQFLFVTFFFNNHISRDLFFHWIELRGLIKADQSGPISALWNKFNYGCYRNKPYYYYNLSRKMFIYLNGQPANLPYNNQYTQRTGSDEDLFHAVKFAEEEMSLLEAADKAEQENRSDEDLATAVACIEKDICLVEAEKN